MANPIDLTGIENETTIDLITRNPKGDYTLYLVESSPWDGDGDRILKLQSKVNHYLTYISSGRLVQEHPKAEGHKVKIHLEFTNAPDTATMGCIESLRKKAERSDVDLELEVDRGKKKKT